MKEQSAGKIYHREADQASIKEAENDILESFALPPETCSSEFSSLETLEQSFENFWTEPFLMEDTYIQTKYPLSLAEGGFSTSPSCFNDGIDFIHQVMQKLPEN